MVFAWFLQASETSMFGVCLIWDLTSKGQFEHWNIRYIWGLWYLKNNIELLVNHWFSMLTLLTFKTTSSQNFWNFSVQISPNNNKLDIFEIYTKRGVGKCPRWTFLTLRKPRKSINKSGNSFGGHPVLLHIFKIKYQKQKILRNLLKFFGSIYQNVLVLVNYGIFSSPYC